MLYGETPAERAQQTLLPERTLRRHADAFDEQGMVIFLRPTHKQQEDQHRSLPVPMRQLIVDLKTEHPGFTRREIAEICSIQFERRPSHNTVKQVLADGPPPSRTTRQYPHYADIPDPAERRLAVIQLHAQGWSITSIAEYLAVSRPTIYALLKRFVEEGVRGLEDKSHANTNRLPTVDLKTRNTIRKLQANPLLGEYRMYGALRKLGIRVSPRTCGRIMAEHRQLYGLTKAEAKPKEPKLHPFKATFRHEIWSLDIRYIEKHQIPTIKGPFYVISVMDNFSRAILASDIYQAQDLISVLLVLYAAIEQHGCPLRLVTDNGSVFRAKQAMAIYGALEIQKEWIHKRQSWENLIESHFSIMRRMSNYHFEHATTWEQAKEIHRRFVEDYNQQPHWAHRKRDDHRHTPAEVLGWVTGKLWTQEQLHHIFYAHRFLRHLDRFGYARFRRWRLYGEEGLPGQQTILWLYGDTLTLEYANAPLSQYTVEYQPDKKHFRSVKELRHFETPYRSPQQHLWAPDTVEWHLAQRLPEYASRRSRKRQTGSFQPPLLDDEQTGQV